MAIWYLAQVNTYMNDGRQTVSGLGSIDDTVTEVGAKLLSFFGADEQTNVQMSSPADGEIEAKIQYTPEPNRVGWVRDREVDFDYIVVMKASKNPIVLT